ncbi:MAG: CRISPR-associated endonuclease Cas2 [Alphaproteobacteria bacterium]|nr:CRISPR-associated endonuclease Cas2 [Alphaproteobacteria bacterium]
MNYNAYSILWVWVMFDLPTETKFDVKQYAKFRKNLLRLGFDLLQYSIYVKHCSSRFKAVECVQRVKTLMPLKGHIILLTLTDKQFGMLQMYRGKMKVKRPPIVQQLELF